MESREALAELIASGRYEYNPIGDTLLVDDIESTISLEERGKLSGLTVIVKDQNKPKVTMGRVIAIGDDPLAQERFKTGEIVFFSHLAGSETWIEGRRFRTVFCSEVTGRLRLRAQERACDTSTADSGNQ